MYVNIAHHKTPGHCGLTFEKTMYTMENLPSLLHDRFLGVVRGEFNANLYWFVVELLTKNGYGYYVDLLHHEAIQAYDFGVLGLVSLCTYDVACMCKPFTEWLFKTTRNDDYTISLYNPKAVLDCSLAEAQQALRDLSALSEKIACFQTMLERVTQLICADIEDESAHLARVADPPFDPQPYIADKTAFVMAIVNRSQKELQVWKNYTATATAYYTNIINTYPRNAAVRITNAVFACTYPNPSAQALERHSRTQSQADKKQETLAALPAARLSRIESILYHPIMASQIPPPILPKNENPTAWYTVAVDDRNIVFSESLGTHQTLATITVVAAGMRISWWKQCGRWGQWVYVYCEANGTLAKWEIAASSSDGRHLTYTVSRVWHEHAGAGFLGLGTTDEYLIIQLKDDEYRLYPNDARYTANKQRGILPEIFADTPRMLLRELIKCGKH